MGVGNKVEAIKGIEIAFLNVWQQRRQPFHKNCFRVYLRKVKCGVTVFGLCVPHTQDTSVSVVHGSPHRKAIS